MFDNFRVQRYLYCKTVSVFTTGGGGGGIDWTENS